MDRGISTVFDVGLACLLVTASALLLVATPSHAADPPDADRIGRAILPSTIAINSTGYPVETSVSDVLVTAATDGAIAPAARTRVEERALGVHRRTSIAASVGGGTPVHFGPEPAPGIAVDAAVFRVGISTPSRVPNTSTTSTTPAVDSVVIVVRTWSP